MLYLSSSFVPERSSFFLYDTVLLKSAVLQNISHFGYTCLQVSLWLGSGEASLVSKCKGAALHQSPTCARGAQGSVTGIVAPGLRRWWLDFSSVCTSHSLDRFWLICDSLRLCVKNAVPQRSFTPRLTAIYWYGSRTVLCLHPPRLGLSIDSWVMWNSETPFNHLSDSTQARWHFSSVQSLSHVQLCDPMNRSTPGLPVHHQLPQFTQTHAHRVSDAIQPSHPLSSPSPPAPNPSQHQGLFQWVSHEVAKVLEFQL